MPNRAVVKEAEMKKKKASMVDLIVRFACWIALRDSAIMALFAAISTLRSRDSDSVLARFSRYMKFFSNVIADFVAASYCFTVLT